MSWTQAEVGTVHRQELAGFDVVGVLRGKIPVITERATVKYLETQPWGLLQEFTARAIAEVGGFRDAQQVAEALGLKREAFIAPVLDDFVVQGLVVRASDGELRPTARFAEVVRERCTARSVSKTVHAILEPVSNTRRPMEKEDRERLTKCEDHVDVRSSSEEEFARWVGSPIGPLAGQRVNSCRLDERKSGQGLTCDVVAFVDSVRKEWGWEVLDPRSGKSSQELRAACESLGVKAEVERLLLQQAGTDEPAVSGVESELAARVVQLEAQLAENSKRPQRDRLERLLTRDARRRLKELIRNAKSEVVLRFPWIKASATEELLPDLEAAVKRGACVVVGFGICQRESDEASESRALAAIAALRSSAGDNAATVVWLGNSHVKEVVVDRRHYLQGSFNMLSFRGDPDRKSGQIRQEVMIYTDRREFIEDAAQKICGDFRSQLASAALQRPFGGELSIAQWSARWRAMAHMGMPALVCRRAMAEFPRGEHRLDRACSLVANGLSTMSADHARGTVDVVAAWVAENVKRTQALPIADRRRVAAGLEDLCRAAGGDADAFRSRWSGVLSELREEAS